MYLMRYFFLKIRHAISKAISSATIFEARVMGHNICQSGTTKGYAIRRA
jgi:hypothetical protein